MVRNPRHHEGDHDGLKRGPWTPEEDQKLISYIQHFGHGSWRALPQKAGLHRCGKSCRLRWTNYLRPDIKRGKFTSQEEQTIIQLHALLGNRWSAIAAYLLKRTDNEIKNYWNTHLKKRLAKNGIDPMTHKPKALTTGAADGHDLKSASNLSHIVQWESARVEAEARLVKEARKKQMQSNDQAPQPNIISRKIANRIEAPPCLDILKAWQKVCSINNNNDIDLESPTSTLSFDQEDISSAQVMLLKSINGTGSGLISSCDDHNIVQGILGGEEILFGAAEQQEDLDSVWMMGKSRIESFPDDLIFDDLGDILYITN